jgi:hypothetical protein
VYAREAANCAASDNGALTVTMIPSRQAAIATKKIFLAVLFIRLLPHYRLIV